MGLSAHGRRLSQSAIVEDTALLPHHFGEPSSADSDTFDDGNDSDHTTTPKRSWFGLRKGRRPSEAVMMDEVPAPVPEDPPPTEAGRSFVVVRKK
jgi:hypothetical protein